MDNTEKQIELAAKELFVEKGYFRTSIPDIVRKSGISTGSVYHHFKSKEELATHLYKSALSDFQSKLEEVVRKSETIEIKIRGMIELFYTLAEEAPIDLKYLLFMKHREIQSGFTPICFSEPFQIIQNVLVSAGISQSPEIVTAGFMGIPLKIIELKFNKAISFSLLSKIDETMTMCMGLLNNAKEMQ